MSTSSVKKTWSAHLTNLDTRERGHDRGGGVGGAPAPSAASQREGRGRFVTQGGEKSLRREPDITSASR